MKQILELLDNLILAIIVMLVWAFTAIYPLISGQPSDANVMNMAENASLMVMAFYFGKHNSNGKDDNKKDDKPKFNK